MTETRAGARSPHNDADTPGVDKAVGSAPRAQTDTGGLAAATSTKGAWPALWALVIGFFMILVDSTIVSVATDSIMVGLQTDLNSVVWVTSAYLLAYVVPLLVSGRLGDQFGPKRIYLFGLVVFTVASALCGYSGTVEMLIAARVLQGLGAALMTPQTMAVITRTFPPEKRGKAMALWGSVAGVAMLVGPLAGGVLTQQIGWEWIFFINVPVGVIAFIAAVRLVPTLQTHAHRFDIPGILLNTIGLFVLTFGLQEGQKHDWGTIVGPISVWSLIITGFVLLAIFVYWQSVNKAEPLMSLELFRDRNFTLANIGICTMGFAITGLAIPLMLYAQKTLGYDVIGSALLMVPMAVLSIITAPIVGQWTDRVHPRILAGFGFAGQAAGLWWLGAVMREDASVWQLALPIGLLGLTGSFIWAPLSATANRNLPMRLAGAGSGVYNMTRQVGAVLGSAAVGVLMQARISAHLGGLVGGSSDSLNTSTGALPAPLKEPFARAMGESVWLPAAVLLIGLIVVLFFERPTHAGMRPVQRVKARKGV
ncbi:MAG: DHA2 family efflux MFS transporter permease subunit [Cumulibacter sp.]